VKLGCQKVNVNFDILKQIGCALVGQIKDWGKKVDQNISYKGLPLTL